MKFARGDSFIHNFFQKPLCKGVHFVIVVYKYNCVNVNVL